ncbi:MAG: SprT family zinc-dependent metalloprotease [Candidatus Paceibacterota bacterium]
MPRVLNFQDRNLECSLKESSRAKNIRITIHHDGSVVVTKPKRASLESVEKFVKEKSDWIFEKSDWFKNRPSLPILKTSKKEYLENKDKALQIAKERIDYFNKYYNFHFKNITIKNQKTRWGSCSRKGNLNFNYKIALLPQNISDYIIVHELCHLKEFNHSKKFWDLVRETVPDYLNIRRNLKGGLF